MPNFDTLFLFNAKYFSFEDPKIAEVTELILFTYKTLSFLNWVILIILIITISYGLESLLHSPFDIEEPQSYLITS